MINYIFGIFIVVGIIYSMILGNIEVINQGILTSGENAIEVVLKMIPVMCLWLGLMKVAEASGLLKKVTRYMSNIVRPIFPELNDSGDASFYIASNMVMNLLGLGNAATPFGLKAMKCMQDENDNKEVATRSMITFLIINTASITLIPTTVISFRMMYNSANPTDIIFACIITTVISLIIGLVLDRLFFYIWRKYIDG